MGLTTRRAGRRPARWRRQSSVFMRSCRKAPCATCGASAMCIVLRETMEGGPESESMSTLGKQWEVASGESWSGAVCLCLDRSVPGSRRIGQVRPSTKMYGFPTYRDLDGPTSGRVELFQGENQLYEQPAHKRANRNELAHLERVQKLVT